MNSMGWQVGDCAVWINVEINDGISYKAEDEGGDEEDGKRQKDLRN